MEGLVELLSLLCVGGRPWRDARSSPAADHHEWSPLLHHPARLHDLSQRCAPLDHG